MKYLKSIISCAAISLITITLAVAQEAEKPMSVYSCNMIILRPWGIYTPGNYGGGSGPAVSENAAKEHWTNHWVSEGIPRQIFEAVCTYQGALYQGSNFYIPPNTCVVEPCQ
jgi:hypothetical protein